MIITHNMAAMATMGSIKKISTAQSKSSRKLGSGYRINMAADDAAGLSISEKLRSQVKGLNKASINAQHGVSYIQVADGALNESHAILHRCKELSVQGANDTNTDIDRDAIQEEIDQLTEELDKIAGSTQFNGMNIFLAAGATPTGNDELSLQVGALGHTGVQLKRYDVSTTALFGANVLDVSDYDSAGDSITAIDEAIDKLSTIRSYYGAVQNRLELAVNNLENTSENSQAAESLIRDTDMAGEMVEFSKNSILSQAAQSVLSQANQSTQGVLSLLQ